MPLLVLGRPTMASFGCRKASRAQGTFANDVPVRTARNALNARSLRPLLLYQTHTPCGGGLTPHDVFVMEGLSLPGHYR